MLVSVIIPVYNVDKYISKCLDSVINQTYSNLEIILINDGSTDDSGRICEVYSKRDERIKVVNKRNGGLMSAWKEGVLISKGVYTTFIDSDDWVEIDMIEKFVTCIAEKDYDLVISSHIEEYDKKSVRIKEKCQPGVYNYDTIKSEIYPVLLNNKSYFGRGLSFCRWGKLIKTELIKGNLNFCDTSISYGEDVNIMFPIFLDCKSIYINDEYLYHYRQNQTSIMRSYKKNMKNQIYALNNVLNIVNKNKNVFNFKDQIQNNFLCMVMALIRNEFSIGAHNKDVINFILKVCNRSEVEFVLNNNTLSGLSKFDRLLIKGLLSKSRLFFYILLNAYKLKQIKNRFS